MSGRIIIQNGAAVLGAEIKRADICLEDGKISRIADACSLKEGDIIDAGDLLVLPGGIDPHVHFQLPFDGGLTSADDFYGGSRAALAGGTTTVIDFITPLPGQDLFEAAIERKIQAAEACCDTALHASVVRGQKNIRDGLKKCRDELGITSCKIYLAYQKNIGIDDSTALKVFQAAAELGIRVLVHCEWGEMVDFNRKRFPAEGKTAPVFHAKSRPPYCEQYAISRAARMAEETGASCYVVHVSSSDGMGEVLKARQRGANLFAETCPHFLLLEDSLYEGDEGGLYVMSPPLRSASHKAAMWEYLRAGLIDTIGSDHCPFMKEQKLNFDDFTQIPNGINGVRERLPLLFGPAVSERGISPVIFANLTSTNQAKLFGLYPQKGLIAAGSDADLVLLKQGEEEEVSSWENYSASDYNCYGGQKAASFKYVIKSGEIVCRDGILNGGLKKGRYLSRV